MFSCFYYTQKYDFFSGSFLSTALSSSYYIYFQNPTTSQDSYALIALGNVWLQTLHQPTKERDREKRHQERALSLFKQVLKMDPKNIWAANGIGCVLAHKGAFNEARDIFAQVREVTSDFCDVWLNIAHVYVEQRQFVSAIQMYENCLRKFYKYHNVEVLQYLARAYYKAGKLKEAKMALLKVRRVAPHDPVLLYNIALVLQKLAIQILKDETSTLKEVLQAVHELGLSMKYFNYLADGEHEDKMRFNSRLASMEARKCRDLLTQAQHQVTRARKVDEEERLMRRKLENERIAFKTLQLEELKKREEESRANMEQQLQKRQEFKEKTKNALVFKEESSEKKKGKGRGRKDQDVSDSSGSDVGNGEGDAHKEKKKKRKGGDKKERKRKVVSGRKRKERDGGSGSDSDRLKGKQSRRKKIKKSSQAIEDGLTAKQKSRIVSKATISTSESESDEGKFKIASGDDSDKSGGGKRKISSGSERSSRSRSGSRSPSRNASRSRSRSRFRSASHSRSSSRSKLSNRSRSKSESEGSRSRSSSPGSSD